mmetsp:Transcript_57769/g.106761  ORF Transcript_57769/g.106761 Transcript_57769/m.106761 type:complete len:96 (+) Transcript_57769:718-1005(+)
MMVDLPTPDGPATTIVPPLPYGIVSSSGCLVAVAVLPDASNAAAPLFRRDPIRQALRPKTAEVATKPTVGLPAALLACLGHEEGALLVLQACKTF